MKPHNRVTLKAILANDVPPEILAAVKLLDEWNKEQGNKLWCLAGTCSREYEIKYNLATEALTKIQGVANTWASGFEHF